MGIYNLVNVPRKDAPSRIRGHVEGETIYLLNAEEGSVWRDGRCTFITSVFVGDHMFTNPENLRRMYANDLATVARLARDAGYAQAMADVRRLIGAEACR